MPNPTDKGKSFGRRVKNLQQRSMGRQVLKYRFEVTPYFVDGLPSSAKSVIVQWRRGAKLAETEPTEVNAEGHSACWNTRLQQVATIYKQDTAFQPKEYILKVQTVEQKHGQTVRKTCGKVKVDLAQFCSSDTFREKDVVLKLSPKGNLRLSVAIQWLQNYSASEDDNISEISFLSVNSDDRDLSSFEEAGPANLDSPGSPGRRARASTCDAGKLASVMEDITNEFDTSVTSKSFTDRRAKRASTGSILVGLKSEPAAGNGRNNTNTGEAGKSISWAVEPESVCESSHAPGQSENDGSFGKTVRFQRHTIDSLGGLTPLNRSKASFGDASPLDSPVDKEHYLAMLCSSDDEDSAANTPAWQRSLKGFFKGMTPSHSLRNTHGKDSLRRSLSHLNPLNPATAGPGGSNDSGPMECTVTAERIEAETDTDTLRKLALRVLEEHSTVAILHYHMENKACRMRAKLEAAEMVTSSLKDRLLQAQSAAELRKNGSEDLTTSLAQSKINLADSEYRVLELKGQLNREKELSHKLMAKLTKLETQYHTEREAQYTTVLSNVPSPTDVFSGPGSSTATLDSPVTC